ncbi:MAG: hypothetical protein ACRDND_32190 [Streptosporangiaceae bacterium]
MAFMHLKTTVRGTRRELRGQSPALARQEALGLLIIRNLAATAVARAAVQAGRQRTSPRTAAERRNGHPENVSYTITAEKSNPPEWDTTSNI